jgi:crotonobetainyl-CoA:carnitine CoA-transferase CaiB-like acyl-CoA transferase
MWLLMLQGDRHWPDFCRAVGREDWLTDPRFENLMVRVANAGTLIDEIEAVMATKPRDEWGTIFDREDV